MIIDWRGFIDPIIASDSAKRIESATVGWPKELKENIALHFSLHSNLLIL